MSYVIAAPTALAAANGQLAGIGSTLRDAHIAAAAPTAAALAAGADEVSTAITTLFNAHATEFQALSAQADAFHAQFVQALAAGVDSYASAEATNALRVVNAPAEALTGRPLIGDGANATVAGGRGADGGLVCTAMGEMAPPAGRAKPAGPAATRGCSETEGTVGPVGPGLPAARAETAANWSATAATEATAARVLTAATRA